MSTLASFGIGINLSHFFCDHRHRARIYIDEKIGTVKDLQNRIASIFNISNFYITNSLNEYLPPCEDVRVLRNDDNIWVMPNKDIQLSLEVDPVNENIEKRNSLIRKKRTNSEISGLEQQISGTKKKKNVNNEIYEPADDLDKIEDSSKKKKRRCSPTDIHGLEEFKEKKKKTNNKKCAVELEGNLSRIDSLKKSIGRVLDIQEYSEKQGAPHKIAMTELIPVLQSHINMYNEKNENTTEKPIATEEDICKGDLPNYKKKIIIPTITDNYLKNKNINIVRIDVLRSPNNVQNNIATSIEPVNNDVSKNQNDLEINNSISKHYKQSVSDSIKGESKKEELNCKIAETVAQDNGFGLAAEKQENLCKVNNMLCQTQKNCEPPEIIITNYTTIDIESSQENLNLSQNDLENNIHDKSMVSINNEDMITHEQNQSLSLPTNWESMSSTDDDESGKVSTLPASFHCSNGTTSHSGSKQISDKDLALGYKSDSIAKDSTVTEFDNNTTSASVENFNGDSYCNQITYRKRKRSRRRKSKKNSIFDETISPPPKEPQSIYKPINVKAKPSIHIKFIDSPDDASIVVPVDVGSICNVQNENNTVHDDISNVIVDGDTKDFVISEENILKSPLMVNLLPKCGDIISFKILRITESYTPEISSYVTAKVTKFDKDSLIATMEIISGLDQCEEPTGKLTLEESDPKTDQITVREFKWNNLISPRLLFP